MRYAKVMYTSAALEAVIFAVLIFGLSVVVPALGDESVRFAWPRMLGGIVAGALLWFGATLLFYRPTTWEVPAADRDWLDQQVAHLRLQPAKKRELGAGSAAYHTPQAFHSRSELWIRPATKAGQLRVDGPRQLIRKLEKRYAKRAATSA